MRNSNVVLNSFNRQHGFTAAGIIFALVVATFVVKVAYAVAPAYYDNYLVRNALKDLAERHPNDLKEVRKETVMSDLSKFYTLNGVRNQVILSSLEVDRMKERTLIRVDYEVRTPFMGNADIVLVFKNHLDSSKPDECCNPSENK
ncbi:MAG: DUF4845 domain-containing protein [Marinagarivorans sp.]|nr:DUF4845 domain-containing protein [Marinagarivorans sp.]